MLSWTSHLFPVGLKVVFRLFGGVIANLGEASKAPCDLCEITKGSDNLEFINRLEVEFHCSETLAQCNRKLRDAVAWTFKLNTNGV